MMSMDDILVIVTKVAIAQVLLVFVILILAFILRVYVFAQKVRRKKISRKIKNLLTSAVRDPNTVDLNELKRYRKNTDIIVEIINRLDTVAKSKQWIKTRKQIFEDIILPRARTLAKSRSWYNRYTACQSFCLNLLKQDEPFLIQLIHDSLPLISLNAAVIGTHTRSQEVIDAVIDHYGKGRRLQQFGYAQLFSTAKESVIDLLENRLRREQDPYLKCFCYRILNNLPFKIKKGETHAQEDIYSDNLDLRLAALNYLCHIDPESTKETLYSFLKDKVWEIRARAAKLLGEIKDISAVDKLELCLRDYEWWVRLNAAQALSQLGEKGIAVLKRQDPNVDKFAYETANNVLSLIKLQAKSKSGKKYG